MLLLMNFPASSENTSIDTTGITFVSSVVTVDGVLSAAFSAEIGDSLLFFGIEVLLLAWS